LRIGRIERQKGKNKEESKREMKTFFSHTQVSEGN